MLQLLPTPQKDDINNYIYTNKIVSFLEHTVNKTNNHKKNPYESNIKKSSYHHHDRILSDFLIPYLQSLAETP